MNLISRVKPSFARGYAKSRGESVAPELWPSHAWVPMLGPTGAYVFDVCSKDLATVVSGTWAPNGISAPNVSASAAAITKEIYSILWCSKINTYYTTFMDVDGYSQYLLNGESGGYNVDIFRFRAQYGTQNLDLQSANLYPIYRSAKDVKICVVKTGLSAKMYIDGIETSYTLKLDGIGTPYYGSTNFRLCGDRYNTTHDGTFKLCYIYDTALTDNQVREISQDPLLPFRRRLPIFYSVPSAGGATFEGTFSSTLALMTLSSSGQIGVGGSVQATAGATTMAQTGQEGKQGQLDATFTAMLLEALGALGVSGVLSADSGALSGSLAGQEGKQGDLSASISAEAAIAGQEGKQGALDTSISLSALLYGSFSDGTQDVFEGTISAAAGIVSADIAGNAGISGAFVSQVVIAAALAGAVGVVGDATLSLDSLAASLAGQIGVSGQVSISVSAGAEIAGKIGVAGEIVAALADLELRLVEIVISDKIYRIVLSTKSGRCVLTTKSGSVTWH